MKSLPMGLVSSRVEQFSDFSESILLGLSNCRILIGNAQNNLHTFLCQNVGSKISLKKMSIEKMEELFGRGRTWAEIHFGRPSKHGELTLFYTF